MNVMGADCKGAWDLDTLLGSATRGLKSPENCEKGQFLVVKITGTYDNDATLRFLVCKIIIIMIIIIYVFTVGAT